METDAPKFTPALKVTITSDWKVNVPPLIVLADVKETVPGPVKKRSAGGCDAAPRPSHRQHIAAQEAKIAAAESEGAAHRHVPAQEGSGTVVERQVVKRKGRDGLHTRAVEANCTAADRVGICSWRKDARHADGPAGRQRARTITAARQVIVVEGRDGLQTGAVEVDRAGIDRIGVCSRRKGTRHADGPAGSQRARTTTAARQVVVVKRRDRLAACAVEVDRAAGDGVAGSGAGREGAGNANSTARRQGLVEVAEAQIAVVPRTHVLANDFLSIAHRAGGSAIDAVTVTHHRTVQGQHIGAQRQVAAGECQSAAYRHIADKAGPSAIVQGKAVEGEGRDGLPNRTVESDRRACDRMAGGGAGREETGNADAGQQDLVVVAEA